MIFKSETYKAALYMRISQEENDGGESIVSQRHILEQFCNDSKIYEFYEYCDEGYSGTNFDRPAFKKMINDIQSGKINLVITKDLSRFGRNYIECGYYIEYYFNEKNIRYISINDNIDTIKNDGLQTMPVVNILNYWYAKDISKKTKSSLKAKAKNGECVIAKIPYGYVRDGKSIKPDEINSKIVKEIFSLAADKYGLAAIAKKLNERKIAPPSKRGQWTPTSVKNILNNKVYLGKLVYGKTSSSQRKQIVMPQSEWIEVNNTHESLVSDENWQLVKNILSSRSNEKTNSSNIFLGKIRCSDCGSVMVLKNPMIEDNLSGNFVCSKYNVYGITSCLSHFITQKMVYNYMLSNIQAKSILANTKPKEFTEKLLKDDFNIIFSKTIKRKQTINEIQIQIETLDKKIADLYELVVLNDMPKEEFNKNFLVYDKKHQKLKKQFDVLTQKQEDENLSIYKINEFVKKIANYSNINELSSTILTELIEVIYIKQKSKSNNVNSNKERMMIIYKPLNVGIKDDDF
jgi:site-specific DNA recombinase